MRFVSLAERTISELADEVDLVVANGAVLDIHMRSIFAISCMAPGCSEAHVSRLHKGPYGWYQAAFSWCNARWEKQTYLNATTVVAVSEKVRRELITVGIPSNRIQTILNGVDMGNFPGSEDRRELGLPADVPFGRIRGRNSYAAKKSRQRHWRIANASRGAFGRGGRASKGSISRDGNNTGSRKSRPFFGLPSRCVRIMRACDVFVFPSRYEACSLALLEALASGLPVVTGETRRAHRLHGHRHSAGLPLRPAAAAVQLFQAAFRSGHQSAHRPHSRRYGDVAHQVTSVMSATYSG